MFTADGGPSAVTITAEDAALQPATLATIAGWELLGWPELATVDAANTTWQLGVEATREIQRLSIFGPAGRTAAEQTTASTSLQSFQQLEKASLPLNFAAFNAYHHGGKVNTQDHHILRDALARGEAEGATMPALRELITQRAPQRS